jgi:perosamine synthetase
MTPISVPFFRPDIGEPEVDEVVATLRSGWLTTGPKVRAFESAFKTSIGASHAVAVNSCTAALHLALEALQVGPGHAVLVPTMTFAATAEVVRYQGATPVLVDCDPVTLNMDLDDAARKLEQLRSGGWSGRIDESAAGIMPVHIGGRMMDVDAIRQFATRHRLWIVEDAAHAYPAAWRRGASEAWQRCGEDTAAVSCFSFYANKTITTGEGGMAVTASKSLADRMRLMSLHGLSSDAWGRYSGSGSWDYRILAPGYKYNLTDIAAAIGLRQVERAEAMRRRREAIARRYLDALAGIDELELPPDDANRIDAWHLFPVRLRLDRLAIDRGTFIARLAELGVQTSVHWRPLHLHPYYERTFGWRPEDLPVASTVWERLVSLPVFSTMRDQECEAVIEAVRATCARFCRPLVRPQLAGASST